MSKIWSLYPTFGRLIGSKLRFTKEERDVQVHPPLVPVRYIGTFDVISEYIRN